MRLIRELFCALWLSFAFLPASIGCFEATAAPWGDTNAITSEAHASNNAHSIVLPHFEPELPAAPGRNEYLIVCVSCHSPRYVTMQPLFPQRQWEETVDKMVKVYGAQMDQDQRAAIVQYLVTVHGPDSIRASGLDEDSDSIPVANPVSRPETAPLLTLSADRTGHAKEVDRGAELFQQDCAACHGISGRGDGFVGQVLLCKPKNLAAIRFSLKLLSHVLWNGKRGTSMPSWRSLPQKDLSALAAYVQSLHPPEKGGAVSPEVPQRGKEVFILNCAPCHGVAGDGKGPAAATLTPGPANFKLKQPDSDYILEVLSSGIPGTAMPAWEEQISKSDRKALANFVRSLFEADPSSEP